MTTKAYHFLAILLLFLTLAPHTTLSKPNAATVSILKNLEGSKKGQNVDGLHQLKRYLARFGYLQKHSVSQSEVTTTMNVKEHDDLFDDSLEQAMRTYQENYRLNVTGHLDAATVQQMMKPRCGCADIINGRNTMQRKDKTYKSRKSMNEPSLYAVIGTRWQPSEYQLTYQILSETLVPGAENMRSVVADALNKWAQYSPFSFQEVSEGSQSNLVFGFFEGDHQDGYPFDGPGNVLGHSFSPDDGRSHYDASEDWSDDPGQNQMDLNSVVLHEIGHLLGLAHTSDETAVMYPTIGPGMRKRELQQDDIYGIQYLYGSN